MLDSEIVDRPTNFLMYSIYVPAIEIGVVFVSAEASSNVSWSGISRLCQFFRDLEQKTKCSSQVALADILTLYSSTNLNCAYLYRNMDQWSGLVPRRGTSPNNQAAKAMLLRSRLRPSQSIYLFLE